MNKILFCLLLCSFSFAQTLTCTETCQHWDDFARECNYATRCEVGTNMARYSYCDRFDSFSRRCVSEYTQVTPYHLDPYGIAISCTEKCQYFDNFASKCLYRTRCEYQSTILKYTECEKWDSFAEKCNFERNTFYWNVY